MALDIQNSSKLTAPTRDVEPQQKQEVKPVAASPVAPKVSSAVVRSVEAAAPPSSSAVQAANKSDVHDVIKEMNHAVQNVRRELEFSIDDDSGQTVVRVMDSETGEIIRQFPEEEALAVASRLKEYLETQEATMDSASKSKDGAQGFIMELRA